VKANGQEPALYFQPFAHFWAEGLDQRIGGTALCDGCPNQTLRQMSLKVNGRPIQHDGAWALDPTNPGVLNRARIALTKFRELGVGYVKLDFLTHGYLESDAWFDEVYAFNDGDHIQFGNYRYDDDNRALLFEPPYPRIWPESYNRARVTSAVITGIYLISEDFTEEGDPVLRDRARKLLQNPAVNAIAEIGRSFRPRGPSRST
jgi:hypothetical protein